MAVTMTITSNVGTFDFTEVPPNDMPKFGREAEYIRLDPQGPSLRKVLITLTGQWLCNDNEEVQAQYEELTGILKANDVEFGYSDGTSIVYTGQRMQVDRYTEPEDWKFYDGTFNIQLYYFEAHTASIPITVKYGNYTFEHIPTWQRKIDPNRKSPIRTTSPGGQQIGSTANIQLHGQLTASDHSTLKTKIDALESALSNSEDTLIYGDFSQRMGVFSRSIVETVPEKYAYFTIDFQYFIGTIVSLSVKKRFSRLHRNPVIKEKPLCDSRVIKFMNLSGQYIDYTLSVQAETITQCRTILVTEVSNIVYAGGFEIEGGFEEWDEDNISVNLLIKKFHNAYVASNIQPQPLVPFNGQFDPAG